MLELRPSCEHCRRDLPPASTEAMICTYECTFCSDCVANVLHDVCPNCGGGFTPRPIRPSRDWVNGNCLSRHPASDRPVHKPVDADRHAELVRRQGGLAAARR